MDLSSHGVIDEIQLGCHSATLGEISFMQISASIIETSIVFNIVENMHDIVTK